MIAIVNKETLKGLRVEEGKRQDIGSSHDPLDGTWTRPSKDFKRQLFIQQAIAMILILVLMLPIGMIVFWIPETAWIVMVAMLAPVIVFVAFYAAMIKWAVNRIYSRHRFRITDEELIVETGLITTNRVLIPLIGVQQVNVIETYWGKRYGLKNVVVNTAGRMYIPNAGTMWGSGILMGLKNADDVAEALLSRVKEVKARSNVGI